MIDIVSGFRKQVWKLIEYDGSKKVSEERIPLDEAGEAAIISLLMKRASKHLADNEIQTSPHLYAVRKDTEGGTRIIYSAGQNPHFVASLWRLDELEKDDSHA